MLPAEHDRPCRSACSDALNVHGLPLLSTVAGQSAKHGSPSAVHTCVEPAVSALRCVALGSPREQPAAMHTIATRPRCFIYGHPFRERCTRSTSGVRGGDRAPCLATAIAP